jgi:hypothetical protein
MRAQLTIAHNEGNVVRALEQVYGPHDDRALRASALAKKSPNSAGSIACAAFAPDLVLMAWPTPGQVVLFVESDGGRLRRVAAQAWDTTRKAAKELKPKLILLVLLDEDKGDEIATTEVGLGPNIKRPELVVAAGTGLVTTAVLGLGATGWIQGFNVTTELIIGSVPALVAAIMALVYAVAAVRGKKLVLQ